MRNVTWTLNFAAIPFMALAAAIYASAFGGTAFQRGVAGLLALQGGVVFNLEVKGNSAALKWVVLSAIPVGLAAWVVGLVLTLAGL